jgi:hypothetical protein
VQLDAVADGNHLFAPLVGMEEVMDGIAGAAKCCAGFVPLAQGQGVAVRR